MATLRNGNAEADISHGGENISQFFQAHYQGSEITPNSVEYGIVVNTESAEPSISPLHWTASGKAHLAAMSRHEAKALLSSRLKSNSANALTDPPVLLRLAGRAHEGDFYLDCEEFDDGICAIALPINTAGSDNYSVVFSIPASRFKERLPPLRGSLKTCRRDMELAAGAL